MNLSVQTLLRLLLITALVLSPVQAAFSMPISMQMDSSSMQMESFAMSMSDHGQNGEMHMADQDAGKHDECGNCQGFAKCSSCSVSLVMFQMPPIQIEVGTRIRVAISDVSLNSTDSLPDYRPPRFS